MSIEPKLKDDGKGLVTPFEGNRRFQILSLLQKKSTREWTTCHVQFNSCQDADGFSIF